MPDVGLPKEELPVQIRHVDGVLKKASRIARRGERERESGESEKRRGGGRGTVGNAGDAGPDRGKGRMYDSPKSMTVTSLTVPHMARSFNSSHPSPPAPTTSIFASDNTPAAPRSPGDGSNSPTGSVPVSFANGDGRDSNVDRVPRFRAERAGRRRAATAGADADASAMATSGAAISDASRLPPALLLRAAVAVIGGGREWGGVGEWGVGAMF